MFVNWFSGDSMLGRLGGTSTILLLGKSNTLPDVLTNGGSGCAGKNELKKLKKPERKPPLPPLAETDSKINSGSIFSPHLKKGSISLIAMI